MAIGLKIRLQRLTALWLLICGFIFVGIPALAAGVTILPSEEIINIGPDVSYLSVPDNAITLQQFRSDQYQSKLKPTKMDTPSLGSPLKPTGFKLNWFIMVINRCPEHWLSLTHS